MQTNLLALHKNDNEEFLDHDEYVYSIRKASIYDYNEKYFVLLPPKSTIHLKVALKVPDYFKKICLKGHIEVSVQQVSASLKLPITAHNSMPKLRFSNPTTPL